MTRQVVRKCLGLLLLWTVSCGAAGYFMGGWETSRSLGLIAGPFLPFAAEPEEITGEATIVGNRTTEPSGNSE